MSLLKHGNNTATFTTKNRQKRAAELAHSHAHRKQLKAIALDNPNNPKLRRDPGVPKMADLHSALERRAVAMDTDLKYARTQAYAKRRVAEQERRDAKRKGGDPGRAATSITGGKVQRQVGTGEVTQDRLFRQYQSEVNKVIETSDIILEVLDARDPEGCRCKETEARIQAKMDASEKRGKRIILVLNKIDLIPHENLVAWIKHLRREFPVVAFKANTQQQSTRLKQTNYVNKAAEMDEKILAQSSAMGAQTLLQLLKNYARNLDIKEKITVGIIGYPNVGKSALINSLCGSRKAATGNRAGLTKTLQIIKLDGLINLIDSPGVIFSGGRTADGELDASVLLRNCMSVDQLEDPQGLVYKIVERCTMEQLKAAFDLQQDFEDADQFIAYVAMRRGKILKGHVPDMLGASKIIVKEWNDGKVEYWSEPPEIEDTGDRGATIATEFSEAFDLAKLTEGPRVEVEDDADLRHEAELAEYEHAARIGAREILPEEEAPMPEPKPVVTRPRPANEDEDQDETAMQEEEEEEEAADHPAAFAMPSRPKAVGADPHNPQRNQQFTMGVKKEKAKARKEANRAAAAAGDAAMDEDDDDMA